MESADAGRRRLAEKLGSVQPYRRVFYGCGHKCTANDADKDGGMRKWQRRSGWCRWEQRRLAQDR